MCKIARNTGKNYLKILVKKMGCTYLYFAQFKIALDKYTLFVKYCFLLVKF